MSLKIVEDPNAYCTMCRQFSYSIVWYPEQHYIAGTQFEVRSHCLRAFVSWRYTKFIACAADITYRWKAYPSVSDLRRNGDRILIRARLPYGARKGEPINLRATVIPPIWAGIHNVLSIWTIDVQNNFKPDEPLPTASRETASECTLSVVAGPVDRLSVYSHPMPGPDGTVRTALVPEDRFGNPSHFVRPQTCELTWKGTSAIVQLQEPIVRHLPAPAATERATVCVPMGSLAPNENVANGRREYDRLVVTGNPVWGDAPKGLRAAFGEFHWHTDFSVDGQRPIREALRCARDALNMDFAAPGDHNPEEGDWRETVAALEEFNEDDTFATFFGWENSTDRGHENYYFAVPDHPLVCGGEAGIRGGRPDKLAGRLRDVFAEQEFIGIPHHTNSVAETRKLEDDSPYWHPYPWHSPEEYLRLVEIFQTRGNQEQNIYDDAWRGWHQNNDASAQDALRLGHRLGFVGGTDNHCGWPGRAFEECEGSGVHPPKSVILTGVWTPRVRRESIFKSLKARHTWAAWDTRALVYFTVNGAPAGDEILADLRTELVAHIRLSAEDALQTVELVSQGAVVWQSSFSERDVEIDVPLGQLRRSTHYYLRALQRDGGMIYASPVFILLSDGSTEPLPGDDA